MKQSPALSTGLDEWMPLWQFRERHTIQIAAWPEEIFAAIRAVTADEIFLFRTLTRDSPLRPLWTRGHSPSWRGAADP